VEGPQRRLLLAGASTDVFFPGSSFHYASIFLALSGKPSGVSRQGPRRHIVRRLLRGCNVSTRVVTITINWRRTISK
jgi:hypothetical protein